MKSQSQDWIISPKLILIVILLVSIIFISSCNLLKLSPPGWLPDSLIPDPGDAGSVSSTSGDDQSSPNIPDPGEPGSAQTGASQGFLEDESTKSGLAGQDAGSTAGSGELKPVGFVNYGEFDAVVMPYTYIPLGSTEAATPSNASTSSAANDGVGDWPNSSRFILVPMGAYSWCIEWEEGDVDEDGQIDYFHYIQNDPTVLDENDSDELEFAEEVAIMGPPSAAPINRGKCVVEDPSLEYIWVEVGAGDYIGMDVDSSDGPLPDDSIARPGITAICWDNVEYTHFSEKAFCTYKSVNWDECLDGPYKGRMYTASEKK